MAQATTTKPMTAEELLKLPRGRFRYELIKGELKKMAPAGFEHGTIAMDVGTSLNTYVKANGLGKVCAAETGFKLSSNPDTVRAADVAFVSRERLEQTAPGKGYRLGAPDLACEVISPSDSYTEVQEKVVEWLNAGTRSAGFLSVMVLVVDPEKRAVAVYHSLTDVRFLGEQDVLEGGEVVPGWELSVAEIFTG
jgi:Uma2 family endonuclease